MMLRYQVLSILQHSPFHRLTTNTTLYHTCSVLNSTDFDVKEKKVHAYSLRWSNLSAESASEYFLKHVIYHEDGLVAINKPPSWTENEFNIHESLPFLAKEFGYKSLKVVSIPERIVSGVTILAADHKFATAKKALRRSVALYSSEPKQTFLAVTIGHPVLEDTFKKYGVTRKYREKKNYDLICHEWGKNEVKRRDVHVGTIGHKIISKSEFASLVSVSSWQMRQHCPRLYLSDVLLSPALGDQIFGPRVGSAFGKPVLFKPWLAPAVKALPPQLLERLNLKSGAESLVPLHFHLCELVLAKFLSNGSDLVLQADPPSYFKWTCQRLDLDLSERFGKKIIEEKDYATSEESTRMQ